MKFLHANQSFGRRNFRQFSTKQSRNKKDLIAVEDSKITLLICDHEALDTTTPRGKNIFGKLVLDAELEADLNSERTRAALQVAKKRGVKLGAHHERVAGKGAKAKKKQAAERSKALFKYIKSSKAKGFGARRTMRDLNTKEKAIAINRGPFNLFTTQQHILRLKKMRLLK